MMDWPPQTSRRDKSSSPAIDIRAKLELFYNHVIGVKRESAHVLLNVPFDTR